MSQTPHTKTFRTQEPHASPLARARELESDLKRALYGAVERVHATKGALYLAASHGNDAEYEIVTSYSYSVADRARIDRRDAIVARLLATHAPVVINSMSVDPAAAEVLFRQQNERLLAMPIVGRGRRIVGIVDLRDKARGRAFEQSDIKAAETICEDIRRILSAHDLYGIGAIPLVDLPSRRNTDPAYVPPSGPRKQAIGSPPVPISSEAIEVIRRAHEAMQKRGVGSATRRRFATAEEAARMALLLPGALAVRGAVAAALTVTNAQWIVATGPLMADGLEALRPKNLNTATATTPVVNVIGLGPAINAERLACVGTVPIAGNVVEQASLTIGFDRPPDDEAKRQVDAFIDVFGETAAAVLGRSSWDAQREAVAMRLVEPDLERFPVLAEHSQLVSGVAHRFAMTLGMAPRTAELVRIAGIVHDVGLRLLDYDRLVGASRVTPEYEKAFREHPVVGASIVSTVLGAEIAEAVLHHHERWDGTGYPARLAGAKIPLFARVLAIADAWVLLRSPWPIQREAAAVDAVHALRELAGTQLDPTLTGSFLLSLSSIDP